MMTRLLIAVTALCFLPPWGISVLLDPGPIHKMAVHTPLKANTFLSPVHRDISLSGTFGELRPNHFHAGLDIKSATGGSGEPVYATAKGYIARIKISAYGYGRALYIQHPDGHMSVYGHLDHFIPSLDTYMLKEHYKRKRFELDLNPAPGTFPITQGQVIAYMGNSGSSTGPHLHFEIRNSAEEALNPLEYGIPLKDDLAPKIYSLKLYNLSQGISMPLQTLQINNEAPGRYTLTQDTVLVNSDFTGIAIRTYDQIAQSKSKLGVYGIKLYADDQLRFHFDMKAISFDDMRYSNAHRDYEEDIVHNQLFHRLFKLAGNKLPIYQQSVDDGWIPMQGNEIQKVKIEVYDHAGNISFLQFYLKQALGPVNTPVIGSRYVARDQPFTMEEAGMKMTIPSGRLYADIYLDYATSQIEQSYSNVYKIHDSTIPLHKSFSLAIKPVDLPPTLRRKAIIAKLRGKSWTNQGGKWNGDWLETEVNSFGNYAVIVDTEAPIIRPVVFKTDMKKRPSMSFKITDNFGTAGQADDLTYNAWIDDQWVLMELDSKSEIITHHFDYRTPPGKHQLRIQVRDDRGNEKTFVQTFIN